jgi:hypothetical protein
LLFEPASSRAPTSAFTRVFDAPASAFTRVFDALWGGGRRQYRPVAASRKGRLPQSGPDKNLISRGKREKRGQKAAPLANPAAAAI